MPPRAALERLFRAAVGAVAPEALVARHLRREGGRALITDRCGREVSAWPVPLRVVGFGKAAARMALGCEQALGAGAVHGLVITAGGCGVDLAAIACMEAGHPIPDRRGIEATERLLGFLGGLSPGTPVLCLISGGASSLLVRPRPPLTLDDKVETSRVLLGSGASIAEINAVRKHLSEVKGGGLLRRCPGEVVGLLLSDVVGDNPAVIASGPTVPDSTTFADALSVLRRYALLDRVPAAVRELLSAGARGNEAETLKASDPAAARVTNIIVGSNAAALEAAAGAARETGWLPVIEAEPLEGDTTVAARRFGARLREHAGAADSDGRCRCVLAGGETTVAVRGTGRGGRNQEFALALALEIAGLEVTALSAGSDGIDGPTDVAGAFVDGTTAERAEARGLDMEKALAANDSYPLLSVLGDHFKPGPTGTNVMDIKIVLVEPTFGS